MQDKSVLKQLAEEMRKIPSAQILEASDLTPFQVQKWTLDLATAKSEQSPFEIPFPFKSIWFKNATTGSTSVNIKFNKNDVGVSRIAVTSNDVLKSNSMFSKAFLDWSAQAGQTIDVYVFVEAEVSTGSLINSGTISIANPSAFTVTNPALSATTATVIFASNTGAKKRTIENNSGADLWIGDNGIDNSGSNSGLKIPSGMLYETNYTGVLYAYSVAGFAAGSLTCVEES